MAEFRILFWVEHVFISNRQWYKFWKLKKANLSSTKNQGGNWVSVTQGLPETSRKAVPEVNPSVGGGRGQESRVRRELAGDHAREVTLQHVDQLFNFLAHPVNNKFRNKTLTRNTFEQKLKSPVDNKINWKILW